MSNYTPEQIDLRNLIHAELQFEHRGETDLKIDELQALVARGWMQEGDENNEFDVTDTGRSAIATTLRQQAERGDGAVSDEVTRVAQHMALSIEYIEKQYPNARQLDRGPIMRNLRRWRDKLLAIAPLLRAPAEQGGVVDEETMCAMWIQPGTSDAETSAFLEGARQMKVALAQNSQVEEADQFGLSDGDVQALLEAGLKPEEIGGDAARQHDRVHELVHWFARFLRGHANPKWLTSHACELAYYIATNAGNRRIDLKVVRDESFKAGVNITDAERGMLERIGIAKPAERARVPDGLLQLIRDARHRICNDAPSGLGKRPFDDPVYGPLLRRLDAMDAQLAAAPSQPEDAG